MMEALPKVLRSLLSSALGIYELAAAPARAMLRKMLESSLRTLIEGLMLSDTAKYGTWQNVRLLNSLRRTPFAIKDVATHHSLFTTWLISYEAIRKHKHYNAAALLDVLARRQSAPIPYRMLNQVMSNARSLNHYHYVGS